MTPEQLIHPIATAIAGSFAGGSLFLSFVDVPARAALDASVGREHFRQMYPRATALQAPAAATGSILGWAMYLLSGSPQGLVTGIALGAVVFYTLIAIMPLNRRLIDSRVELGAEEVAALLSRWGRRHLVRTLLGITAFLALLWPVA